ncbi:MAG: Asp-tRNA(Asn)/Glu-tRNA(Gln) amidotransferase subunit GatC [Eubacteriales bacterium]
MGVTDRQLEELALLAGLRIPEGEREELREQLGQMVDFAEEIVGAQQQPEELEEWMGPAMRYREDERLPSWPREEILQNGRVGESGYFEVPARESKEE